MGASLRERLVRASLVLGTLLGTMHLAHADMWSFVDERGVKHFASSQLDKRYKLMFRAIAAPDVDGGAITSVARYVGVGASGRSVASLELSPGFMAIKPLVRAAADANQLDMALLQAVIATESGFVASAVSPKGAVGLMQVMPATAQRYGLTSDLGGTVAAKLTDPKTNIHTGARYLRDLVNLFPGQLELAVAAYNAGEGAVQKAGNKIPNFKETQNYVRSVMQLYRRLNPLAQHNATVVATAAPTGRVRGEFQGAASTELPSSDLSN
jgi:soluble lytic murein transglycosylase-like protein